jgi:hypothetical protein
MGRRLTIIRSLVVAALLLAMAQVWGQEPAAALNSALRGEWTGVLEYRDYSEPAGSTKRVKLPTWLSVTPQDGVLRFLYTYDDGPTKTVVDTETVSIDVASSRWTTTPEPAASAKDKAEVASIAGLSTLKNGRGTLVLTGRGTESDQPVDVQTTVRVGRNILEILRETRLAGGVFTFRHAYTFVRAQPPAAKTVPAA